MKYDTVVVSTAVPQITVAGASAAGDSVEADTAALMALYNSAGGVNWTTSTNWEIAVPIGTWSGVTTDSNGRVTRLDLRDNNLVGTLPDELGDFTGMLQIYLQDNGLTGLIPDLSGLTSLTHLEMARNQLSGPIPALGALTSLTHIYLQDNELTGLTRLDFARNKLTSIPALSGLTSLTIPALTWPHLPDDLPARQPVEWADPGPERPHLPHLARLTITWTCNRSTCKTS